MSDINFGLKIKHELERGENVHAWAFCVPEINGREAALAFAHGLLDYGWMGDENPDLFFVGNMEKPANIEECRDFMRDVSLRPVYSKWRVGVICAADRLLLPAANSLLKITEEPPSHVKLLFILQKGTLLPTLRSRVRFLTLLAPSEMDCAPLPSAEAEWLDWAEKIGEIPEIIVSLQNWGTYALKNGNEELAFKIENIRILLDGGKLSKAMAVDLILLALKEELNIENLFGNFW